jgi:ribosome-binding protein aMBF1 (putative translation factor)
VASRTTVILQDRELFQRAMKARGYSVRGLADRLPCNKSMVQALRAGDVTGCSRHLADCIEDVLGVKGLLFVPKMSTASDRPVSVAGRAA